MTSDRCKHINPEILRWARETAGYRLDEVLVAPSNQLLKNWEQGKDYPTYDQLEELASYYERPLVLFFFPEVPKEEEIKHSFRSFAFPSSSMTHDKQPPEYPAFINLMLRKVKGFQLKLYELIDGSDRAQKLISNTVKLTNRCDVKECAEATRVALGINLDQQKNWNLSSVAFDYWRDILTTNGLFVFKDRFKDWIKGDYCSGFCIYDKQFPVIFINNSHPPNRQIFTLFHELAHIILSNNSPFDWRNVDEQLCNHFAAEFLLPASDFANDAKQLGNTLDGIGELAQRYCVSRDVVLLKMLTDKIISYRAYSERKQSLATSSSPYQQEKGVDKMSDLYISKVAHLGKRYIKLVLDKYRQQQITVVEAADYLYIKPSQFDQLKNEYNGE